MSFRVALRANALKRLSALRSLISRDRILPLLQLSHTSQRPCPNHQCFSTTPAFHKKGQKLAKEQARASASENSISGDDPSDFTILHDGISSTIKKLENDLSKLRTGGRFNPEILENLRVRLAKDSKSTNKLGDLAQVVPKGGRSLMILVGEKDHVKAVVSAIQGSPDLNLQPQQDAHNANQLNVPIPPPTKESRDRALQDASKAGEVANTGIRNARAAMQKRLRAMELAKAARPDDLKKAAKEMEKIVEKGTADVKKIVDAARKTMESS